MFETDNILVKDEMMEEGRLNASWWWLRSEEEKDNSRSSGNSYITKYGEVKWCGKLNIINRINTNFII